MCICLAASYLLVSASQGSMGKNVRTSDESVISQVPVPGVGAPNTTPGACAHAWARCSSFRLGTNKWLFQTSASSREPEPQFQLYYEERYSRFDEVNVNSDMTGSDSLFVWWWMAGFGNRKKISALRALVSHQWDPGTTPGPGVKYGLILLFLYSAPRGYSGFPLSALYLRDIGSTVVKLVRATLFK